MYDNLCEKLSNHYACIINKEVHKSEREKGLSVKSHRQFKGTCWNDGKYGHWAVECKLYL